MADPTLAELTKRIDLDKLYPPFKAKVLELLQNCLDKGAIYVVTSGLRTYEEQAKIYAIGRTTRLNEGIKTKAWAGKSPHNFAIAIDCMHSAPPWQGKLVPDDANKNYKLYADEAVKLGLDAGYYWKGNFQDTNHVQLDVKAQGITWDELDKHYRSGGYPAVFAYLDKFSW
jgi:D-alanyl-D-alanine carboxypeptidase.